MRDITHSIDDCLYVQQQWRPEFTCRIYIFGHESLIFEWHDICELSEIKTKSSSPIASVTKSNKPQHDMTSSVMGKCHDIVYHNHVYCEFCLLWTRTSTSKGCKIQLLVSPTWLFTGIVYCQTNMKCAWQ